MAPSFASTSTHVDSVPAPDQTAQDQESTTIPAPKKKPRSTALADAKKILRASTAVTSKSLDSPSARRSFSEGGAPQFVHRPPDIARHRRKCAVCHHPEREIIEDLFIHWHSPATIAEYYEDDGSGVNWVSIYRHAYAFGLDEVRRRNLRFAFELIIEQAADIHATPAAIIASARALGSCVNPDGQWTEPERRVHVVNHIYRHDSPTASILGGQSFSSDKTSTTSSGASAPEASVSSSESAAPSKQTEMGELSSYCAPHPPVLSSPAEAGEVEGRDVVGSGVGGRSFSSDNKMADEFSSFRAPHPRDVVDSLPASLPPAVPASAPSPEIRNSVNSFKSKEPPISNR